MKILLISLISFTLVACGGGGSSDDTSNDAVTGPNTPEPSTPATIPSTTRSIKDLSVPDGFNYSNSASQSISIDINALSDVRAFISIYTQYSQQEDGSYLTTSNSKIVSGPLVNGKFSTTFPLEGSATYFLVEIWRVNSEKPLQKEFSKADNITWIK